MADRWLIRPLAADWTDPLTAARRSASAFQALMAATGEGI